MYRILAEGTFDSPRIILDEEIGFLEIRGNSTMEDPMQFYKDLAVHLSKFANSQIISQVNIVLGHFNTSSSKWIYHILRTFEGIYKRTGQMEINWYYEDDDETIAEAGEDYQSLIKVPFYLIEMEPEI
ncbi:MAG: DUF1987 domain-containing protein [bacterium]